MRGRRITGRSGVSSGRSTSTPVNTENEVSVHDEMLKTLLRTPHSNYDETLSIHKQQFERDPNFYGKLAYWAVGLENNVVRDVNEIFLAVLFNSPHLEHREAAYVLLQKMPPYQVERVGNLFTGVSKRVKVSSYEPKPAATHGVTIEPARYGRNHPDANLRGAVIPPKTCKLVKTKKIQELIKQGLVNKNATEFSVETLTVHHPYLGNRSYKNMLKNAVCTYLRVRESDPSMMDGALLRFKKTIAHLYMRSNTLPQNDEKGWINRFLFNGEAPEGTRIGALTQMARSTDPVEHARLISEFKIPYPIAILAIKNITPSVLVALIEVMSPQELLSNLESLQKRGAMDNPDIKKLIEGKLDALKKGKVRVDAMKGSAAASAIASLDKDIRAKAVEVTDAQLKHHGAIKARTAILIDKSGSMTSAIELGKQVAASISQACVAGNEPIVYLFDSQPIPIVWSTADGDSKTKSAWDKKLQMFNASGGTAPGMAVKAMLSKKQTIEQIVLITDEGENNDAYSFVRSIQDYEKEIKSTPAVVILRVGQHATDKIETACKKAGISVDVLDARKTDSVSMPNVLQMLSRRSVFDTLQEILALPLPTRAEFDASLRNKKATVSSK